MKILTVASQKGGVGKTALALNIGWALARANQRTLVIDVDPQSGLSRSVASQLVNRAGLNDALRGEYAFKDVILPTRVDGYALMPLGRVAPWDAAAFESQLTDGAVFHRLREELRGAYDILLIDTPAGLGNATLGSLRASDYVLSPLQAEPGALRAASPLIETLGYLATEENHAPHFLGYVLSMVNRADEVSSAIVTEAWRTFPEGLIFDTTVPRHPVFLEATSKGVPVGVLGGEGKRIGLIFDQLAAEIQTKMESEG